MKDNIYENRKRKTPTSLKENEERFHSTPLTYQDFICEEFAIMEPLDQVFFKMQKMMIKASSFAWMSGILLTHKERPILSNLLSFLGLSLFYMLSNYREKRQNLESQISNFSTAHANFFKQQIQSASSSSEQKQLINQADFILNINTFDQQRKIAQKTHLLASSILAGMYFFNHMQLGVFLMAEALITTSTNIFRFLDAQKQLYHIKKNLPLNVFIPTSERQRF